MDYEKLIDDLRSLLGQYGEKIPYGELVCAEGGYGRAGDLVWTDPEPYYIEQSADAITALLAENARLKKYEDKCHDCPIVCAKTEIIKAHEELEAVQAELEQVKRELQAYKDTGLEPEDFKRAFHEDAVLKLAGQALGIAPDRLRELAQADREGRVHIEEKTYQCPKCGAYRLTPRLDKQFYFCFNCKTQFTCAEAEAALEGMKNG